MNEIDRISKVKKNRSKENGIAGFYFIGSCAIFYFLERQLIVCLNCLTFCFFVNKIIFDYYCFILVIY